jgi:hypothetical protein
MSEDDAVNLRELLEACISFRKRKSSLLLGVGEDAAIVARDIAVRGLSSPA